MPIKANNVSTTSTNLSPQNTQQHERNSKISDLKPQKALQPSQKFSEKTKIGATDSPPSSENTHSLYKNLVNKRKATKIVPEKPATGKPIDPKSSNVKVPCDPRCICDCRCGGCLDCHCGNCTG